jgi:hypothetical protein
MGLRLLLLLNARRLTVTWQPTIVGGKTVPTMIQCIRFAACALPGIYHCSVRSFRFQIVKFKTIQSGPGQTASTCARNISTGAEAVCYVC